MNHSFPYRRAVGSLLYLSQVTRPDIAYYSVNYASRFLSNPLNAHWHLVRRIRIRYVKKTIHFGSYFDNNMNLTLEMYSDADYAGCMQTRRSSTSGYFYSNLDHQLLFLGHHKDKTAHLYHQQKWNISLQVRQLQV